MVINSKQKPGAALTVRPVRLEPHHFLRFTNRGHFPKSPKHAIKINPKKYTPPEPHHFFRACAATAYLSVDFLGKLLWPDE